MIGISAGVKDVMGEGTLFHTTLGFRLRLTAVIEAVDCVPFMISALRESLDPDELLERVGGVLLTGSKSNVYPSRYGISHIRPVILHSRRCK